MSQKIVHFCNMFSEFVRGFKTAASHQPTSLSGAYEFVGRLHGHESAIHTLDFSSEGTYLASGGKYLLQ